MKLATLFTTAALCTALLPMTGCGSLSTLGDKDIGAVIGGIVDPSMKPTGDPSEESTTTAGTLTVVVVDLSRSTYDESVRRMYLEVIGAIAGTLGPGDRLAVLGVDKASVQNSKLLFDVAIPAFSYEASEAPRGGNVLLTRKFRESERARYDKELLEYGRRMTPQIVEARASATQALEDRVLHTISKGSDLPGAMQIAGSLFSVASPNTAKHLVVLSDGIVRGVEGADWQDKAPTREQVSGLIKEHVDQDIMPDLTGVEVVFIGGHGRDAAHFAALSRAWVQYFSAAGGTLEPRFFMGHPVRALLEAYCGDAWQPPAAESAVHTALAEGS